MVRARRRLAVDGGEGRGVSAAKRSTSEARGLSGVLLHHPRCLLRKLPHIGEAVGMT